MRPFIVVHPPPRRFLQRQSVARASILKQRLDCCVQMGSTERNCLLNALMDTNSKMHRTQLVQRSRFVSAGATSQMPSATSSLLRFSRPVLRAKQCVQDTLAVVKNLCADTCEMTSTFWSAIFVNVRTLLNRSGWQK